MYEQNADLTSRNNKLKARNEELATANEALTSEVARITKSHDEFKNQYTDFQNKLNDAHDKIGKQDRYIALLLDRQNAEQDIFRKDQLKDEAGYTQFADNPFAALVKE